MTEKLHPCSNEECDIRSSCARAHDEEYRQNAELATRYLGGEACPHFVIRRALGGGSNHDVVFSEARRGRGKIHNAHAGQRRDYPGSRELFGHIFGKGDQTTPKRGARISNPNLPKRPDLMVSRHIAKGRNIKKEGEDK